MKKLFFFLFILLCVSMSSFAQIRIDHRALQMPVAPKERVLVNSWHGDIRQRPDTGQNISWVCDTVFSRPRVLSPISNDPVQNHPVFPTANFSRNSFLPLTFGALRGMPYRAYYRQDSSGIRALGWEILPGKYHLMTSVSSPAADSIEMLHSFHHFGDSAYNEPFPFTYGDRWSSIRQVKLHFLLSIPAWNISADSGHVQYTLDHQNEVVAWGDLSMRALDFYKVPTVLVRHRPVVGYAFYFQDQPATHALQQYLRYEQSPPLGHTFYRFYVNDPKETRSGPAFELYRDNLDIVSLGFWYDTQPYSTLKAEIIPPPAPPPPPVFQGQFKLFPNPVVGQGVLHLQADAPLPEPMRLLCYDAFGKLVGERNYPAGQSQLDFIVDDLAAGGYALRLLHADGSVAYFGRFIKAE